MNFIRVLWGILALFPTLVAAAELPKARDGSLVWILLVVVALAYFGLPMLARNARNKPLQKALSETELAKMTPSERRTYIAERENTKGAAAVMSKQDMLSDPISTMGVIEKLNHHNNGVFAGVLRGSSLSASVEDRACIIGPPGTGKTAFLVNQLLAWAETKRSFICLDIKPEIYGITRYSLESIGYKVIAFNPTESGTWRYNPLDDLDSIESIGELVSNMIANSGEENAVFFESARDLLDAMINHLKAEKPSVSLPDVRDFLTAFDSPDELLDALRASKDAQAREIAAELRMVAKNERLFGSILASMRAGMKFLRYPAIKAALSESDFSLKELGGEQPVAIFLQFEESKSELLQRLTAVIIGHFMRYLIDHTNRSPVLLLLDEIGNAKGINGLTEKLNTIRSRNLPVWMYWQSVAQMTLYSDKATGADGRELIMGACDFVGVFRLNDKATAEYVSETIGTVNRVVRQTSFGTSSSSSNGSSSSSSSGDGINASASGGSSYTNSDSSTFNESRTLQEEAVVKPHQLRELNDGEMVAWYRGEAWRNNAQPYFVRWPLFKGRKPLDSEKRPTLTRLTQDTEKVLKLDLSALSQK
ncbi:TPA: type IV secretory system conjugative DNA transfer family protein [Vibrio cholerae]|uniref:type IV secretory system conjugative DNA transfer family protein n=1 Tax=Vibrio cholerae TaxID=666 RepID=UPI00372CCCA3|nr:type IV secretory system conjugative DNA transfer family protein [Vibrio cholerae]EKF9720864.1 type IV secretory system conjugative DNA transfer family protein [Vibrio cholerae]HDI3283165.1 type IV secretory system conjugative DNA transfer family protein [Vibrio cholerae]